MLHHNEATARSLPRPQWNNANVAFLVEVFRLFSDPTRVRVVWSLTGGERSVNDIAAIVGTPASTVSRHLAQLRAAHLVASRRIGTRRLYRLENDYARMLITDALSCSGGYGRSRCRRNRTSRDGECPSSQRRGDRSG